MNLGVAIRERFVAFIGKGNAVEKIFPDIVSFAISHLCKDGHACQEQQNGETQLK
jgi:hypothetical protein